MLIARRQLGDVLPPLRAGGYDASCPDHRTIIKRKIAVPEPGGDIVDRPRLTERIRELVGCHPVINVFATAGSGKTTAVASAVHRLERPVAWVSLDGTEQAAGRLLVYLEAAVSESVGTARDVASDALRRSLPIGEAAGLLAESLQGSRLVVVCDNVERVAGDETCLAVLSCFARYLPPEVAIVLISRVDVRLDLGSSHRSWVGVVGELDLAFDLAEAQAVLEQVAPGEVNPSEAVAATGGWVMGVLFDGWRNASSRDLDPESLRDYVAKNIFSALTKAEQSFLVHTSVLVEVTAEGARRLGQANAAQVLASLSRRHLPVSWSSDRARVTPHPVFRDFLQEALEREDAEVVMAVRRRYADLLIGLGQHEEAVDELLRIGDLEAAGRLAAIALPKLVARMDFEPAARWLDALGDFAHQSTPEMASVILQVAFALEQCGRGVELLDRHGYDWLPPPTSPEYEEARVLAGWCLWHVGRIEDAQFVTEPLPPGRNRAIAQTLNALATGRKPPPFPGYSTMPSGPVDGLLARLAFIRGRLEGLDEPESFDPWRTILGGPWVIAALRATGRLDVAMAMYQRRSAASQPVWLQVVDAVDLMLDLGRGEDAWASVWRGREPIPMTRSKVFANMSLLMEAKLSLRLNKDPARADRVLAEAHANGVAEYAFTREAWQIWSGLSLLLQGRDAEAQSVLQTCLASMRKGERDLDLATAAVYLAEAQWRLGLEDESDRSADLALKSAFRSGSHHLLLTALADVPSVAVRAADTRASRTSPWHEVLAVLAGRHPVRADAAKPRLVLEEFGEPILTVDGQPSQPRLTKSIELLSYLLGSPDRSATRNELLGVLFNGRNDAAGRSYLRQALYRLREALPEELGPTQDGDVFRMVGPALATGSAQRAVDLVALAGRQGGEDRLRTLTEATTSAAKGPFLANVSSDWVAERREVLRALLLSARTDAGKLAFRLNRYREARSLADYVLREDPYREQAWQLAISLAHATGSDDEVLALYQRYTGRMLELGVPPSDEVRRLVTQLRRQSGHDGSARRNLELPRTTKDPRRLGNRSELGGST